MAGDGKRWWCEFQDNNDNECIVNIYDDEFTGDATEVTAGGNPVVISYMAQGDEKYANIKASEAKIELVSTSSFQYLDIFAYANKRFHANIYRGGGLVWTGYANPEYYSEPFLPAPYITTLTFTDGIVELKNKEYVPASYVKANWKVTVWDTITQILNVINLGIPISTAINIDYTSDGDGTVTSRIWESICIDWRVFRNSDGTFWTYYDVLDSLLKTFQARIYQSEGRWIIERVDQKYENYHVDNYLSTGVYSSTTSAKNDVVALTSSAVADTSLIRFINIPTMLEVAPAMKEFDISQEYGNNTNLLPLNSYYGQFNADDFDTDGNLLNWTTYAGLDYAYGPDNNSLIVYGVADASLFMTSYIYNTNVVNFGTDFKVTIRQVLDAWKRGDIYLKFELSCRPKFTEDYEEASFTVLLRPELLIGQVDAANPYTLQDDGTIYSGSGSFSSTTTTEKTGWHEISVSYPNPPDRTAYPDDDYMAFRLYINKCDSSVCGVGETLPETNIGMEYQYIRLYFEKTDGKYDREETYDINSNYLLTPSVYDVKFGETPPPYGELTKIGQIDGGYLLLNKYILYDSTGDHINIFSLHEVGGENGLIFDINRTFLFSTYRQPMLKLRGSLIDKTDAISFRSVIQDYNSRYYIPIAQSWIVKDNIWEGEWLCFYPSSQIGEFSDDLNDDFFT